MPQKLFGCKPKTADEIRGLRRLYLDNERKLAEKRREQERLRVSQAPKRVARSNVYKLLEKALIKHGKAYVMLGHENYFDGLFLSTDASPFLEDGFVSYVTYEELVDCVRREFTGRGYKVTDWKDGFGVGIKITL